MDSTSRLQLPYIMPSQAQKNVTHNDALRTLDCLVQPAVKSRSLGAPPASPAAGDGYVVAAGATGSWAGHDQAIACFVDGDWQFFTPAVGWQAYDLGAAERIVFTGGNWISADAGGSARPFFGINSAADTTNRLTVAATASLFTHEGGGHQLKLNKATAADTASHLFQTAYSGRAEFGLAGDDDFHIKVSADGTSWTETLVADSASGAARFPAGIAHPATGHLLAQLLPCPVVPEIWRSDAARPATPRSYTVSSISGSTVTLTEARVPEIFYPSMQNVSMVRIWNITKSPAQSAWVDWNNSDTAFNVKNAADIATWSAGDTLQLGDPNPTGSNTLGMIAIDISNFLYNSFGAVFPQKGLLMTSYATGQGGGADIDGSGSGALGSAVGTPSATDGTESLGYPTIFTGELSPISNSNLVFVRENLISGSAVTTAFLRVMGVYV